MTSRRGEKIGWTGGWLGATLWILIFSIIWLIQRNITGGVVGLSLYAVGVVFIYGLAPWRHPQTEYWKLLSPLYVVLMVSVIVYVRFVGGLKSAGLSWWSFFWMASMLIPLPLMGKHRWKDRDG